MDHSRTQLPLAVPDTSRHEARERLEDGISERDAHRLIRGVTDARESVDQSRTSKTSSSTVVSIASIVRMLFQRSQRDSNSPMIASCADSVMESGSWD